MPFIDLAVVLATTVAPTLTGLIGAAAAKASAIHACGAVTWLEPDDFEQALGETHGSLVFHSERGRSRARHEYLASHRGLLLYTKSHRALRVPTGCHEMVVKSIWKSNV